VRIRRATAGRSWLHAAAAVTAVVAVSLSPTIANAAEQAPIADITATALGGTCQPN